jgi:molecular chaperone GrpE
VKGDRRDRSQAEQQGPDGRVPAEAGEHAYPGPSGIEETSAGAAGADRDHGHADHASKGKRAKGLKGKVEELEGALEKAEREAAENYDRWLRARAEYDNLRKRTRREIEQAHLRAGEDLVRRLLPVLDNLEKAIEASRQSEGLQPMEEGLLLVYKGLIEPLRENGVAAIDPLGERFDPAFHEAVLEVQTEGAKPGTVVQVLQKGYLMNGIVLRPAKVAVAGGGEGSDGIGLQEPVQSDGTSGGEV